MPKLYCILLDMLPLNDYLLNFLVGKNKFKIMDQIVGGSTMQTLPLYFTGCTPSQYSKNGLGWRSFRRDVAELRTSL